MNDALATAATLHAAATQAQQTAAGRARLALALAYINTPPWDPAQTAPAPANDPAAQEAAQYDVEFTGSFSTWTSSRSDGPRSTRPTAAAPTGPSA